jgi:hypothetical protein
VRAHQGSVGREAAARLGAKAFAVGDAVGFATPPDLHTAAHEAAHVVQQRGGVQLRGGVGQPGDEYERHADEVADAVVAGTSAEPLLDRQPGSGASGGVVQCRHARPGAELPVYTGTVTLFDAQRKIVATITEPMLDDVGRAYYVGHIQGADIVWVGAEPGPTYLGMKVGADGHRTGGTLLETWVREHGYGRASYVVVDFGTRLLTSTDHPDGSSMEGDVQPAGSPSSQRGAARASVDTKATAPSGAAGQARKGEGGNADIESPGTTTEPGHRGQGASERSGTSTRANASSQGSPTPALSGTPEAISRQLLARRGLSIQVPRHV